MLRSPVSLALNPRLHRRLVVAIVAWPAVATAQLPPLAELSVQYLPASQVPSNAGLEAQVSSYDASVNVPLVLGDSTFLIPGAQYHVDSIGYEQAPDDFTQLNALHSLDFPILLVQVLSPRWSLSLRVWPGSASDFGAIDSGALRIGGLTMAAWSPHRRLTLGGGVVVSYAFGELLPLPLAYVDWKPKKWLRVEASLPSFASALLLPGERWELGIWADVTGNEYSIRQPAIAARYPCAAEADRPADSASCLDHLAYSVVSMGAIARFRLLSSLWLGLSFGRTLFRRYDLKSRAGGGLVDGQVELPSEYLLRASLTFRLPDADEPASQPPAPR